MSKASASKQYTQINTQTGIIDADPHRLIQMLFAGAMENIAIAKGCMQRGDIAGKGVAISKAISIVGGLQDSVNPVNDSDLSDNLVALYGFVTQRLLEANMNNDTAGLDESAAVIKELQAGWNGIRSEAVSELKSQTAAAL